MDFIPYFGQIIMFPFGFPPGTQFASCDGRLMSIQDHQALFSLIGTTYGGDGHSTFALPDLRGRTPVGTPTPDTGYGETGGIETITLSQEQLPQHEHQIDTQFDFSMDVSTTQSDKAAPEKDDYLGEPWLNPFRKVYTYREDGTPNTKTNIVEDKGSHSFQATVENTGESQPISNMQPYLGMAFYICIDGVYPSRPE